MTIVSLFAELSLDPRLLQAVDGLGFTAPTPIQAQAIPYLLAGRDVIGGARTGSGKTAAFGLPLLHRLGGEGGKGVRALILTPTRELALQVRDAIADLGREMRPKMVAIYGGAPYQPQVNALRKGASIVVGTPGRVLDLLKNGALDLSQVEMLVLDEADEMLRMGFIEDVETIVAATPATRQVALFSATMPAPIRRIAERHLKDPAEVHVEEKAHTTEHITQRWMRVPHHQKIEALVRVLACEPRGTTLVFVRTRENALEATEALAAQGLNVESLHGGISQAARERVLRRVRAGAVDVLVATDVAARGLDVDHVTHVVNLDLPEERDVYVHRIGRTGRAGRAGAAITFVTPKQVHAIRQIARHVGAEIEQAPVPTDVDVARIIRRQVADELLAQDDDPTVRRFLAELAGQSGRTELDLAVSALALLAKARGLALSPRS